MTQKLGLILPGGGARAAYQVGVLKAINEITGKQADNVFPVISGTSAGGINAVVLASHALNFNRGVHRLEAIWRNFHVNQVFHADTSSMARTSARWLGSLASGGIIKGNPKSLFDIAPLRTLLERHIQFARIQQAIDNGQLDAVGITLSGYASAHSTTFFQAHESIRSWDRNRREGIRQGIRLDHLMATAAIPFVFPPVLIGNEYFGDGAIRQLAPLSPPIHMGANRLLVIGVRNESPVVLPDKEHPMDFPTFGTISAYTLDALFSDGIFNDLERLSRINRLLERMDPESTYGGEQLRPIDCLVLSPSEDIRQIARNCVQELPRALRLVLRSIGVGANSPNLLSYLLFEPGYTRRLIRLGYSDSMDRKDTISNFLRGEDFGASHGVSANFQRPPD